MEGARTTIQNGSIGQICPAGIVGIQGSSAFVDFRLNPYKYLPFTHFTLPDLCAFAFPSADSVFQSDVPAMPATDDLAHLHNPFAQWKTEVRAQILYRIDAVVPAEQRDV